MFKMPMVKIVTDTGCDLPDEIIEEYGIALVPLGVRFGEVQYRDRVDLSQDRFYELLLEGHDHPQTSAPTPEDFVEVFERELAVSEDVEVLGLFLSGKASATYRTAELAAELVDSERLHVFDTNCLTLAHGMIIYGAARLASEGKSVGELVEWVRANSGSARAFALLDTLKYLHRGGRLSTGRYLVGSLFGFKPFVANQDGVVAGIGRVRKYEEGLSHLREAGFRVLEHGIQVLGVGYTTTADLARELQSEFSERFPDREIFVTRLGAGMGTHLGPGCIGLAWIGPSHDEFLPDL